LTIIGATGHQQLPAEAMSFLIDHVQATVRSCQPPLCVLTALAAGADQLVARAVLREGGSLYAIVPAAGYESTLDGDDLHSYEELLMQAAEITRLEFGEPSEQAYWAAGKEIVNRCDLLIAIWDGQRARGLGGTGDVVDYARSTGKDVRVIWPSGAVRA
jgi:hypothetical protein